MGDIAGRLSNLAVITSDNPRTEPAHTIVGQIRDGILRTSPRAYTTADLKDGFHANGHAVEPDRKKAIALGISASRPGDTVLIAGKGHETYQIIGSETRPFDDREVAGKILLAMWEDGGKP
jgi:UDP-N-acetylmuramyl tripeptide synthase